MKYTVLFAAIAAVGVKAQKSGGTFTYTAGGALPTGIDPLVPFEKTPEWPKNFGGKAIQHGPNPKGCSNFEVIIARGTSEPGPFGAVVGDPLMARVLRDMPDAGIRGYAVQYDASMTSYKQGADDIVKRLKQKDTECPNQKFALVGYSQGAMATHTAMSQLSSKIQDKIVAVILYGDMGMATGFPEKLKEKVLENCAGGDFICVNLKPGEGHLSYNTKGTKWHDQSAKFMEAAFKGTPLKGSATQEWSAPWLDGCAVVFRSPIISVPTLSQ